MFGALPDLIEEPRQIFHSVYGNPGSIVVRDGVVIICLFGIEELLELTERVKYLNVIEAFF